MVEACGLSVVLPAYMEEENLRLLLPRITRTLESLGISWEVIVVDTATPFDKTADVCRLHGCTCVSRQGGDDFGDAVRTGIARTAGEFIIFMDADGSHPPEFLADLWQHRGEGDVVVASRYVRGGATENPRFLVWMSRMLNVSYSTVLGLECRDVSNSFKLYRGADLRSLDLVCDHFDIIEEILYKLRQRNPRLRIHEIPFTFKKRMFGETKRNLLAFILSYAYTMIRLRCLKPSRPPGADRGA